MTIGAPSSGSPPSFLSSLTDREEEKPGRLVAANFAKDAKDILTDLRGGFQKLAHSFSAEQGLTAVGVDGLYGLIDLSRRIIELSQNASKSHQELLDSPCDKEIVIFEKLTALNFEARSKELELFAKRLQIWQTQQNAHLERVVKSHYLKLQAEAQLFEHVTAFAELGLSGGTQIFDQKKEDFENNFNEAQEKISLHDKELEEILKEGAVVENPPQHEEQAFGSIILYHIRQLSPKMVDEGVIGIEDILVLENSLRPPCQVDAKLKEVLAKIFSFPDELPELTFDLTLYEQQEGSDEDFYDLHLTLGEEWEALNKLNQIKQYILDQAREACQQKMNQLSLSHVALSKTMDQVKSVEDQMAKLKDRIAKVAEESFHLQLTIDDHVQRILSETEDEEIKAEILKGTDLHQKLEAGLNERKVCVKKLEEESTGLDQLIYQQQVAWSTYE